MHLPTRDGAQDRQRWSVFRSAGSMIQFGSPDGQHSDRHASVQRKCKGRPLDDCAKVAVDPDRSCRPGKPCSARIELQPPHRIDSKTATAAHRRPHSSCGQAYGNCDSLRGRCNPEGSRGSTLSASCREIRRADSYRGCRPMSTEASEFAGRSGIAGPVGVQTRRRIAATV